jgi:ferritin-like metal-binding protein YciE
MARESLQALYVEQLRDLYNAEQQIMRALPKMADNASHPELKKAFHEHQWVTQQHAERLEQLLEQLGVRAGGHRCKGMEGLVAEGEEVMRAHSDSDVLDAAMIAAAQRVEHYEIAGYGCARTYANMLGLTDHAELLQRTLNEEAAADHKLTELAETVVNVDALKV